VPASLVKKMNVSQAEKVAQQAKTVLLTGEGSPLANAKRVFRTELNRAHGEAYQAAAFAHPDVVGTRFLLSPNHKKQDICDMHANVNRYGLGRGVYPDGQNPWPAHPNTLSFVEVVFADEVSDSDKEGKESRLLWLKKQGSQVHQAVLGKNKAIAFRAGHIVKEGDIGRSWKNIKARLKRKGIDTKFTSLASVSVRSYKEVDLWLKKPSGNMAFGDAPQNIAEMIGAKTKQMTLSEYTMKKQLKNHPELLTSEYLMIEQMLKEGEVIRQGSNKVAVVHQSDKRRIVVVKATADGQEIFIATLFRIKNDREVRRLKRNEKALMQSKASR